MVADGLIPAVHVRHSGQELGQIIAASSKILGQLPLVAERVARFRSVGLSDSIALQIATRALTLRYPNPELTPIRADLLLTARRREDAGNTLWEVANRVQENLLHGGMRDHTRTNRAGKPFRAVRAIGGLQANVTINLGIWEIAESYRLG